jgi:hypothetical protein
VDGVEAPIDLVQPALHTIQATVHALEALIHALVHLFEAFVYVLEALVDHVQAAEHLTPLVRRDGALCEVLVEQAGDLVGDVFAPGVANVVRKGKRHGGRGRGSGKAKLGLVLLACSASGFCACGERRERLREQVAVAARCKLSHHDHAPRLNVTAGTQAIQINTRWQIARVEGGGVATR